MNVTGKVRQETGQEWDRNWERVIARKINVKLGEKTSLKGDWECDKKKGWDTKTRTEENDYEERM